MSWRKQALTLKNLRRGMMSFNRDISPINLFWRILGSEIRSTGCFLKVSLVEDSKFLRAATARTLANAGYEVVSAGDGGQGLVN